MSLSRLAAAVGGILLSKSGRRLAGRHAGKLALATLAWELYQSRRKRGRALPPQPRGQQARLPKPGRWSGRTPGKR
ncbi:cysteine protease [Brevundimonas sp. GCM10030266]|uniref:cysteine protease n=1 Tax=Brevundimonas sp. GCM10030266 TaxID=3273386 RepID=UPI003610ED18